MLPFSEVLNHLSDVSVQLNNEGDGLQNYNGRSLFTILYSINSLPGITPIPKQLIKITCKWFVRFNIWLTALLHLSDTLNGMLHSPFSVDWLCNQTVSADKWEVGTNGRQFSAVVSLLAQHLTENQRDMKTDEDWAVSLTTSPSTKAGAGGDRQRDNTSSEVVNHWRPASPQVENRVMAEEGLDWGI